MVETPPIIVILAGPNGAGKSTIAPFFLRDRIAMETYVNADEIARGLSGFAPESSAFEAGRIMLRRLRQLASNRQSFAFETTLSTRSFASWLTELKRDGYFIELVFLWLSSADLAIERVSERVKTGGHGIPESVIRRRYERGTQNLLKIYDSVVNRWLIYNNSNLCGPTLICYRNESDCIQVQNEVEWNLFRGLAT